MAGDVRSVHAGPGSGYSVEKSRLQLFDHDIRAAVSDVVGGLELLDLGALPPSSGTQVERVRAAADTLGRLVEELLAEVADEPARAQGPDGRRGVPLVDLLQQLERRWRGHAAAHGLTLRTEIPADLAILIEVEAGALERTLSNLLGNALKYSGRGTVTLRVDVHSGRELLISVSDQGPGFSDDALAMLFEFGGRPGSSQKPGTGMGLHICKELVDQMGGQLVVANGPGGGARATLILPPHVWSAVPKGLPNLTGLRVLLAEDGAMNRHLFQHMLKQMHADVTAVGDGRLAIAELDRGEFDLALIDMKMPQNCGLEVIHHLRALPGPRGRIPVLAVTACMLRSLTEKIYAAGANGILAKPVLSAAVLGQAVTAVLAPGPRITVPDQQRDPPADPPQAGPADPRAQMGAFPREALDQLLAVAGPDAQNELLRRLLRDFAAAAGGLAQAVETRNPARLRAESHVLISLTGAIGASDLTERMRALNSAAHDCRLDFLGTLAPQIVTQLDDIQAGLARIAAEHGVTAW